MITFRDGPAKGQTLQLRRAPFLLRVVQAADRSWDALDQLDDKPKRNEQIIVYQLDPQTLTRYHLSCGRWGGSGWYMSGEYFVLEPQPDEEHLRETDAWRRWATQQTEVSK